MRRNARVCTFCVMDDSVAELEFDEQGQCNCCRNALQQKPHEYFPDEVEIRRLKFPCKGTQRAGSRPPV